jgi:hypothetical protein
VSIAFQFYEKYGVEEYYIYDPDELTLEGWQRLGGRLVEIPGMGGWVSPILGMRFDWQPRRELVLYGPSGRQFLSFVELGQEVQQAQQEVKRAQLETQQARSIAEQAELAIQEAVPRLLGLGLTVPQVASALGLAIETVIAIGDGQE